MTVAENAMTNEQKRIAMAENLRLHYFNNTLFEKGLITEKQRNQLSIIIDNRKPSSTNK